MTYDEAARKLHQASFNEFVSERKRLAAELKAAGDKDGAARLAKLPRPAVSAWAVNQLWWKHEQAVTQLIEAAARVKAGDREAGKQHRQLLAELRDEAAEILRAGGNAATESTLRRVATTLSAVAANGGFDPDPPGSLSVDRDPPGFETFLASSAAPTPASDARESEAERRRAEAEQKRAEEEQRKRRLAERERLSAALREAQELQATQQREATRLRSELESAEQGLKQTRALLAEIEEKLAEL